MEPKNEYDEKEIKIVAKYMHDNELVDPKLSPKEVCKIVENLDKYKMKDYLQNAKTEKFINTRAKVPFFELTDKQVDKLNKIAENKKWAKKNEFIRKNICILCENLLYAKSELLNGVHKKCIEKIEVN